MNLIDLIKGMLLITKCSCCAETTELDIRCVP